MLYDDIILRYNFNKWVVGKEVGICNVTMIVVMMGINGYLILGFKFTSKLQLIKKISIKNIYTGVYFADLR
ncbi:MAG TPA: hypothetical protein DCM08_04580 [Microscillaceae bacterium]|nr:hypothetical protein [Microscillaceae bacterium]